MSHYIETKKRVPQELTDPLAYAFGFDRGDIQDNRMGFISHWQKGRLRWYILSYTWSILTWLFLLTGVPVVCGLVTSGVGWFIWAFVTLALFSGFWAWKLSTVLRDLRQLKVITHTGIIEKYRRAHKARYAWNERSGEYTAFDYFILVDNQQFEVTRDQFNAFKDFQTYTLYIASASQQILSAEIVIQDDENVFDSAYDEGVVLAQDLLANAKPDLSHDTSARTIDS